MQQGRAGNSDHIDVDTAVLDAVGNVLFDVGNQVRQVDVAIQADTVPAVRAFDGWLTGKSLTGIADSWHRELATTAEEIGTLLNKVAQAASNYRAAEDSVIATMPPDPTYFRGR